MINDFLKTYYNELLVEKIDLEKELDVINSKLKEENKFLALLEESNESYFAEFSPRVLNKKNNEKAGEIRELIDELQARLDLKLSRYEFLKDRLATVEELLSETAKPVVADNISVSNSDVNIYDYVNVLNDIKDHILLDPYRANLELEDFLKSLNSK